MIIPGLGRAPGSRLGGSRLRSLNFTNQLRQSRAFAFTHIEKANADPLFLARPLSYSCDTQCFTEYLEEHFDADHRPGEELAFSPHLAPAKAEINDSAGDD